MHSVCVVMVKGAQCLCCDDEGLYMGSCAMAYCVIDLLFQSPTSVCRVVLKQLPPRVVVCEGVCVRERDGCYKTVCV